MSWGSVEVLFRRKRGRGMSKLVGDACARTLQLMDRARLEPFSRLQVFYGSEEKYYWCRVEAVALGEKVIVPANMRRQANGLIKHRWL